MNLQAMQYLLIYMAFIPVFAFAYTFVAYVLGLVMPSFRPENGSFGAFYKGFLLIAAINLLLALIGVRGLIAFVVMVIAYRYVFDAAWWHALVIGILGSIVGMFGMVIVVQLMFTLGIAN